MLSDQVDPDSNVKEDSNSNEDLTGSLNIRAPIADDAKKSSSSSSKRNDDT